MGNAVSNKGCSIEHVSTSTVKVYYLNYLHTGLAVWVYLY